MACLAEDVPEGGCCIFNKEAGSVLLPLGPSARAGYMHAMRDQATTGGEAPGLLPDAPQQLLSGWLALDTSTQGLLLVRDLLVNVAKCDGGFSANERQRRARELLKAAQTDS